MASMEFLESLSQQWKVKAVFFFLLCVAMGDTEIRQKDKKTKGNRVDHIADHPGSLL